MEIERSSNFTEMNKYRHNHEYATRLFTGHLFVINIKFIFPTDTCKYLIFEIVLTFNLKKKVR